MKFNYFLIEVETVNLQIYKQLSTRLNALRLMKKSTPLDVMRQFANGIFMSKLSYGAETWVGAPQYLIDKLQHLQLEAARICIGPKSRYYAKTTLLKTMNWIDVRSTAQFSTAKLIHQILHTEQPALLSAKFRSSQESIRETRMTGSHKLGSRPKSLGSSRLVSQHFRCQSYNIYAHIPEIITLIKKRNI